MPEACSIAQRDRFQNRKLVNRFARRLDLVEGSARMAGKRRIFVVAILVASGLASVVSTAQPVSREQDIGDLRLGQRIKVDDGTCPAGQIKEISGTRMTSNGIVRSRTCIPRVGPRQK